MVDEPKTNDAGKAPRSQDVTHCSSLALVRPELLTRTAYVPALPNRQLIRLHANENPWSIEDVETGDEALQRAVEKLSQSGVKNKSALTASNASNYTIGGITGSNVQLL